MNSHGGERKDPNLWLLILSTSTIIAWGVGSAVAHKVMHPLEIIGQSIVLISESLAHYLLKLVKFTQDLQTGGTRKSKQLKKKRTGRK